MKKYLTALALAFFVFAPLALAQPAETTEIPFTGTTDLQPFGETTTDNDNVQFDDQIYNGLTQTQGGTGGGINIGVIKPYADSIIGIINFIFLPVIMAVAFIVFIWGIYKYFILGASNESEKAEGRKFAMWGIIGFAIIISIWGLVNTFTGALNLQGGRAPRIPTL